MSISESLVCTEIGCNKKKYVLLQQQGKAILITFNGSTNREDLLCETVVFESFNRSLTRIVQSNKAEIMRRYNTIQTKRQ